MTILDRTPIDYLHHTEVVSKIRENILESHDQMLDLFYVHTYEKELFDVEKTKS